MAQLDPADIEAIAARVVEMLGDVEPRSRFVSAAELSRRLGVARSTVYERADELGATRIGNGPRARLRFDPKLVEERLGCQRTLRPRTAAPRFRG